MPKFDATIVKSKKDVAAISACRDIISILTDTIKIILIKLVSINE